MPNRLAEHDVSTAPRVVLCTADVGCGHGRAAEAILFAIRQLRPDIRPRVLEALACTPGWFNVFYRDAYLAAVRHLPRLNGWMYDKTDTPGQQTHNGLAAAMERAALKTFCGKKELAQADLIICTHFLCARVLSRLKGEGKLSAPIAVVVTDQHPHAVWRVPNADLFFVPSEVAAAELMRNGIEEDRICVTGIPIDARFDSAISQANARQRHQLPQQRPIVLLTGGGLGLGGMDRALEGALSAGDEPFVLVVCGRNEKLHVQLTEQFGKLSQRCRIIGLTSKMHELMAAADVLVGKPGGLTTSEAIARHLPMVLLKPIPGQEERNAQFLVRSGVALRQDDPYAAGQAAAQLVLQANRLSELRRNIKILHRGGSATLVAKAALQLIHEPEPAPLSPAFV